MQTHSINGELRSATGKKSSATLRKENLVPAVIYGGEKNIHFQAHKREFKNLVYSPDFKIAEITIDGAPTKSSKKMILELPIRFKGESPGVKGGGKLQQLMRRVKVKVSPEDIVDVLYIDISTLELNMSARVKELEINDGIEVMLPGATPVAIVETPRALKSADAADDAAQDAPAEEAAAADAPAE